MAAEAATTTEAPEAGLSALDALELAETGQQPEGAEPTDGATDTGADQGADQTDGAQPDNQDDSYWPGKFNTVDDMRAGYENLERFNTQTRQELAAAQAQLEHARQLLGGQQAAGPQQNGPLGFAPEYNHPAQGYTADQLEELKFEDPARLADYIAQVRIGQLVDRLTPFLAEQQERSSRADGEVALSQLRAKFGSETVEKHGQAVAQAVIADEGYYIDPQTRQSRLEQTLLAEIAKDMLANPGTTRPRDATTGQFVSAEQRTTHVESGSSGPTAAGVDANVPQEIRDMRSHRETHDKFGALAPILRG